MTESRYECENCGEEFWGYLHANNEVINEENETVGCSASEYDSDVPTLCMKCGAAKYIV